MFIMLYNIYADIIEIYNENNEFIDDIFVEGLKMNEILEDNKVIKLCQDWLDNNDFTEVEYQIYKIDNNTKNFTGVERLRYKRLH